MCKSIFLIGLVCMLGSAPAAFGDLIGWWTFDEGSGTVAQDSSGNGIDGTFVGSPEWVAGIRDGALQFDGASAVSCGNTTALELTGPMTIACWVNPASLGAAVNDDRALVGRDGSYAFKATGSNLRLTTPGVLDHTAPGAVLAVGEWQHAAVTFQPDQASGAVFYLNGTETDRVNASAMNAGTGPFRIANNEWSQWYTGMIDDVRVYNHIVPAAEIAQLAFRPKAYAPSPADGAKAITQPLFTWTKGTAAVWHNVYVGTSPELTDADLVASRLMWEMHWHTPGLIPGQTYYWRVDEIAGDETVTTGDVWTFTAAPAIAYSPKPRNGDKWIDTGVTLSWVAGMNATKHDVYFGTDEDAVASRDASVFQGTQNPMTYKPGTLAEQTTYYWAVDEHNGAMHQGELWRFTTGPAVGGVKGEYFSDMDLTGAPALTRLDSAIDFDWGSETPGEPIGIDQFSVRWTADLEIAIADTYTFITRTDDGSRLWLNDELIVDQWVDQGPTDALSKPIYLEPGIYALQMEYYENGGGAVAQLLWQTPSLAREIIPVGPLQPPVRARAVYPKNADVNVPQDLMLKWTAGDKAVSHDVYFGDDADAVAAADTGSPEYQGQQAETSLALSDLEWGKTYYWRIDEVNDAEADSPWVGAVWSFTTADAIVVDDFETYTDDFDAGEAIWQTWIDGLTNLTGSIVGYFDAPFAEQTIVHSGRQSMPFDYNNINSPYYSEAELEFAPVQNWTVNGVDALTLWFRGNAVSFIETGPDSMTMSSTSGDVWTTVDHMRLVYKQLTGDGSIVVRVDSMTNTWPWAKAGVIIRESLDPGSSHALMCLTPEGRTAFQNRLFRGEQSFSANSAAGAVEFPYWVKLERRGAELTGWHSNDGVNWVLQANDEGTSPNPVSISMSPTVYIGLMVTSNNLDEACVVEYSGIQATGSVSGSWQKADIGPAIPGNDPDTLYVAIEDSSNNVGVSIHPDATAVTLTDWTEWVIPFSEFGGVNPAKIQKLYIGVGDRNNPQPDGAGRVYIDDIRVTKPAAE